MTFALREESSTSAARLFVVDVPDEIDEAALRAALGRSGIRLDDVGGPWWKAALVAEPDWAPEISAAFQSGAIERVSWPQFDVERTARRITIRVSPDLYSRLISAASTRQMSINQFCITALEMALTTRNALISYHILDFAEMVNEPEGRELTVPNLWNVARPSVPDLLTHEVAAALQLLWNSDYISLSKWNGARRAEFPGPEGGNGTFFFQGSLTVKVTPAGAQYREVLRRHLSHPLSVYINEALITAHCFLSPNTPKRHWEIPTTIAGRFIDVPASTLEQIRANLQKTNVALRGRAYWLKSLGSDGDFVATMNS